MWQFFFFPVSTVSGGLQIWPTKSFESQDFPLQNIHSAFGMVLPITISWSELLIWSYTLLKWSIGVFIM